MSFLILLDPTQLGITATGNVLKSNKLWQNGNQWRKTNYSFFVLMINFLFENIYFYDVYFNNNFWYFWRQFKAGSEVSLSHISYIFLTPYSMCLVKNSAKVGIFERRGGSQNNNVTMSKQRPSPITYWVTIPAIFSNMAEIVHPRTGLGILC